MTKWKKGAPKTNSDGMSPDILMRLKVENRADRDYAIGCFDAEDGWFIQTNSTTYKPIDSEKIIGWLPIPGAK